MSTAATLDLLLFLAGEPDTGVGSMQNVQTSIGIRLLTVAVPVGKWTVGGGSPPAEQYQRPPLTDSRPWHYPAAQVQCADMVFREADRLGQNIGVVDINRPQGHEALVARWVGPNDVLPVLVRPDGAGLRGVESFSPSKVRSFMRDR